MRSPLLITGVIALPIVLFLSSFFFTIDDKDFFLKEFHKHNVYAKVKDPELNLQRLLEFFNDPKAAETGIADFNEREESHIRDVKEVLRKAKNIYVFLLVLEAAIIFMLLLKKNEKKRINEISKLFFFGGCATLSILTLVFFMSAFSFDSLFTLFHRALFNEGTWVFSANDTLIRMFPLGFFIDFTREMLLLAFTQSVVITFFGYAMRKLFRKNSPVLP